MISKFLQISAWLLLAWATAAQLSAQMLVPATNSNTVLCGTDTTLCDAGGCGGNYAANIDGFTVFRATGTATITFSGTYNTEIDNDLVIFYDGIGTGGTVLAIMSGPGGTFNYTGAPGQSITVRFISDDLFNDSGFSFNVTYGGVCATEYLLPQTSDSISPCGVNRLMTDHAGPGSNYAANANGYVVYQNSGAATINVTGPYATEPSVDLIRIYDGVGTSGTLLHQVSGIGNMAFSSAPGQTITIQLISDSGIEAAGFDFSVSYSGPCVCPTFTASATPSVGCSPLNAILNVENVPANAYTVSTIPFTPFSCAGGINGPEGDDDVTGTITLPFTFFFYGTPFTQLGIATNGNLQLGAGPYNTAFTSIGPIPGTNIDNMIALNYADWRAEGGPNGTISYQIQGTAPNRRFIVCFNNLIPYGPGFPITPPPPGRLTGQIVLYEGTNIIDMFVTTNNMPTYNTQTQGLQATNGQGVGVGGRNYTNWTATNSGVRFNPNATYAWSPSPGVGQNNVQSPTVTGLISTTVYTVTSVYAGCTNVSNVTVTANPTPTVTVSPSTTITCGSTPVVITASGATNYVWSTGATTAAITVSPASFTTYMVTGTNAFGCSHIASSQVNIAPAITVSPYSLCQGAAIPAGQGLGATITSPSSAPTILSGTTVGAPTYVRPNTFPLGGGCTSSGLSRNYGTVTFTPSITGVHSIRICGISPSNWDLQSGLYQNSFSAAAPCANALGHFDADNGGAGCNNGDLFTATLTAGTTYIILTTSFSAGTTGTYNVTVTPPAAPPATLAWFTAPSGGSSLGSVSPFNPIGVAGSGLANSNTAGTYTFYAAANGCRQPVNLTINAAPTVTIAGTLNICAGQSTTLTASGGTGFIWNTGATTAAITVNPVANTAYIVTVTNAGCTATSSSTVTVNAAPSASIAGTLAICAGQSTTLTASSGTGFLWNTGATTAAITVSPAANTAYTVTVSNAGGCTATSSSTVTVNTAPSASIAGTLAICVGQSTTLTASGGTGFLWSTGATTAAITVSPATNTAYTVTVSNAGGCTATSSSTVTVNTNPSASIAGNLAICAGQSTTLTASGGTGFIWNTGATTAAITVSPATNTAYTVTVSNASGCTATSSSTVTVNANPAVTITGALSICSGQTTTLTASGGTGFIWNTGATTAAINVSPVVNTTYTVTVSNASGCTATSSSTVTITTNPVINITGNLTICAGATATLTVPSATGYLWSTGATTAVISVTPASNTAYSVTATLGGGCTASTSSTVTVNPLPSPAIAGSTDICAGNSTTLTASGGTGFIWNTGATTAAITVSPASTTGYTVTVSSAAGCSAVSSTTVTVNPVPTPSVSGTNTICVGNSTILSATGGGTYTWSNGATTANITVSPASTTNYIVTVTSAANCTATASRSVTVGTIPTITLTPSSVLCNGNSTGSISSSTSGGTGTYSYLWSTGATGAAIISLPTGSYSLTVSDGICTATSSASVSQPSALSLSIASSSNAGCGAGANQGSITLNTGGGSTPYQFAWSNGATSQNISGLSVGNYSVTLTDNNGCRLAVSQTITNGGIVLSLNSAVDTICFGATNGSIAVTATPAAGASFLWNTGATASSLSNLPAGSYTVSATNVNAGVTCTDVLSVVIRQPSAALTTTVSEIQGLDCSGDEVAILSNTPTGGWGGYSYLWSTGNTNASLSGIGAGTYSVSVSDSEGCQTNASGTINPVLIPQLDAWVSSVGLSSITVDLGATVDINAGFNELGVTYTWSPAANLANPNLAATSVGTPSEGTFVYVVTATAGNCSATDSVSILVRASFLGFPTAFTPNGDGDNDRFRPIQLNTEFVKNFRVFNRWGQMIYETTDLNDGGWDGTYKGAEQPREVYIYYLQYQLPQDSAPQEMRGEFTLMR